MSGHVFDYSGWRPNVEDLKAAGVRGVCRYLAPEGSGDWKRISKFEYDGLQAAGMPVALVWENARDSWTKGYLEGFSYGQRARAQARALGFPDDRPLYIAIDTDVVASTKQTAIDHVRGFVDAQALGPQGVYAERDIIEACHAAGLTRVGWEAAARSWSTIPSNNVSIRQLVTKSYPQFPPSSYDENDVLAEDWGQHPLEVNVASFELWQDVRGQVWRVALDGLSRTPVPNNFALMRDKFVVGGKVNVADATMQVWLDSVPNVAYLLERINAAHGAAVDAQSAVSSLTAALTAVEGKIDKIETFDVADDLAALAGELAETKERLGDEVAAVTARLAKGVDVTIRTTGTV